MRIVSVLMMIVLSGATAVAQQSVPPPPMPANDAPANAAVLKLLQVGMPESVVLEKIRASTNKFDTSIDALITLKQAGATEAELKAVMAHGAAPVDAQPAAAPTDSGPSLAETLQFIRDKVNQQGSIAYTESVSYASNGADLGSTFQYSEESQVIAVDPAGGLSIQEQNSVAVRGITSNGTATWQVNFKDVDRLEVLNSADYKHRVAQGLVYVDSPPFFELLVHLASGKTVQQHSHAAASSGRHGKATEMSESKNVGEFILHFRDEDSADRVAKAMIHAIELCGGGSQPEPF
jgi:hypothetical protein